MRSFTPSVTVMESNINSSINPIRNRELPQCPFAPPCVPCWLTSSWRDKVALHHCRTVQSLLHWYCCNHFRLSITAPRWLNTPWFVVQLTNCVCCVIWTNRVVVGLNHAAVLLYGPVLLLLGPGSKASCTVPSMSLVPVCLPSSATVSGTRCTGMTPLSFLIGSFSALHLQLANKQFTTLLHLFDWSSRSQQVLYSS